MIVLKDCSLGKVVVEEVVVDVEVADRQLHLLQVT